MTGQDCTTYVSCAPVPSTFVPALPPDVPAHAQSLAATGFDGTLFLLVVVAAVIVLVVAPLLIIAGRRSKR